DNSEASVLQVIEIGGSCRDRTYDQLIKRDLVNQFWTIKSITCYSLSHESCRNHGQSTRNLCSFFRYLEPPAAACSPQARGFLFCLSRVMDSLGSRLRRGPQALQIADGGTRTAACSNLFYKESSLQGGPAGETEKSDIRPERGGCGETLEEIE